MKVDPKLILNSLMRAHRPARVNRYAGVEAGNLDLYLSFLDRRRICDALNPTAKDIIGNKLFFPVAMGRWGHLVPENIFLLHRGRCLDPRHGYSTTDPLDLMQRAGGRFVIKPVLGRRSRDVHFVSLVDGVPLIDGHAATRTDILSLGADGAGSICCRFIEQHPDLARIFPEAIITLRILTYFDEIAGKGRFLAGFARIGTKASAPFEATSKAGLQAELSLDQGVLNSALTFEGGAFWTRPRRIGHAAHPETGTRIEGVQIPHWHDIRATLQSMLDDLPFFEFIGWDIIVTPESFAILEANVRPGTDTPQYFRPLLADDGFRAFLLRRGLIKR